MLAKLIKVKVEAKQSDFARKWSGSHSHLSLASKVSLTALGLPSHLLPLQF